MKKSLPLLLELCDLDARIHALETQLDLYPKMLAELDAKEAAARRKVAQADERHRKAHETRRRCELDVKAEKEKITRYQIQQNQVKSNKEYEALTHEIAACKAKIDEMDLAGIEALDLEEKSESEKRESQRLLDRLMAEHKIERDRIASQTTTKQSSLDALRSERELKFATLEDEFQEIYDLLNDRYPGAALSSINDGHCKGCGMSLNKHVLQDIHKGEKMIRCESCMRILHDHA